MEYSQAATLVLQTGIHQVLTASQHNSTNFLASPRCLRFSLPSLLATINQVLYEPAHNHKLTNNKLSLQLWWIKHLQPTKKNSTTNFNNNISKPSIQQTIRTLLALIPIWCNTNYQQHQFFKELLSQTLFRRRSNWTSNKSTILFINFTYLLNKTLTEP